ncbi:MAG: DNA-3-methyladenine glycosylase [Alphaproteobacteria bacterium]|nr:DNA-3-methyladenine glycosylase [Alphaproteobacteria bacterium]
MRRILTRAFFDRPTLLVAEELVGKFLARARDGVMCTHRLTEVEAYDGPQDKASHAHRGRTPRNAVMFGPAGVLYVYVCYGMHHMLNVTTGPEDYPAAVLIRGVEGISGPGRLTKALDITRALDRLPASKTTGLWFEDRGGTPPRIQRTARIGVAYSGPVWSRRRYRFVLSV